MRWLACSMLMVLACGPAVVEEDVDTTMDEAGSSTGPDDGSTGPTPGAPPAPNTTGPIPTTGQGGDGIYYATLTAIIAETTPFQFVGTIEADESTITMNLTPLTLDVTSVDTPRELLPTPIELTGVIDREGVFSIQVDALQMSGAANPVTGSDLVSSLRIEGPFAEDVICARVSGMVTSPANIDLTGSTFSAIRTNLGPTPSPDELPLPSDIDCG